MAMQGFLLGLSSGAVCSAYCAPVLIPYFLGEKKNVVQNFMALLQFLTGRLLGYLAIGFLAWGIDKSILQSISCREFIMGSAYIILSGLLIFYSFSKSSKTCPPANETGMFQKVRASWPFLFLLIMGLATAVNLCPPFLLAVAIAMGEGTLFQSALFLFMFFLGTSVFMIPVTFVGMLRRFSSLHIIGKMTAGLIGVYYFYSGTIMVIGSIWKT